MGMQRTDAESIAHLPKAGRTASVNCTGAMLIISTCRFVHTTVCTVPIAELGTVHLQTNRKLTSGCCNEPKHFLHTPGKQSLHEATYVCTNTPLLA